MGIKSMDKTSWEIKTWHNVTHETLQSEIIPCYQPAILKGLCRQWPSVSLGLQSPQVLCSYLSQFDQNKSTITFMGDASIGGRFFYSDDMHGFNFEKIKEPFMSSLARILHYIDDPAPPSIYIGAASVLECLPGFAGENYCEIVDASVEPRIWIGNAARVTTHFDEDDNIACVVAGRRRFSLFPPNQLTNLYVGPLDFTLAGQPVSMVDLHAPDFEKYPRFRGALASMQVAELEPGDALYIPKFWWHHVESLANFNVLINYWWNNSSPHGESVFNSLIYAILTMGELPEKERQVCKDMFNHYVFKQGLDVDPFAHIRPENRGVLGKMTPKLFQIVKQFLRIRFGA
jgi:hypothetical protein